MEIHANIGLKIARDWSIKVINIESSFEKYLMETINFFVSGILRFIDNLIIFF